MDSGVPMHPAPFFKRGKSNGHIYRYPQSWQQSDPPRSTLCIHLVPTTPHAGIYRCEHRGINEVSMRRHPLCPRIMTRGATRDSTGATRRGV
jgi:hypothetical protein